MTCADELYFLMLLLIARWTYREGDIESINITSESMGMSQMNVNYVKSVLQSINLSTDEVSRR